MLHVGCVDILSPPVGRCDARAGSQRVLTVDRDEPTERPDAPRHSDHNPPSPPPPTTAATLAPDQRATQLAAPPPRQQRELGRDCWSEGSARRPLPLGLLLPHAAATGALPAPRRLPARPLCRAASGPSPPPPPRGRGSVAATPTGATASLTRSGCLPPPAAAPRPRPPCSRRIASACRPRPPRAAQRAGAGRGRRRRPAGAAAADPPPRPLPRAAPCPPRATPARPRAIRRPRARDRCLGAPVTRHVDRPHRALTPAPPPPPAAMAPARRTALLASLAVASGSLRAAEAYPCPAPAPAVVCPAGPRTPFVCNKTGSFSVRPPSAARARANARMRRWR